MEKYSTKKYNTKNTTRKRGRVDSGGDKETMVRKGGRNIGYEG